MAGENVPTALEDRKNWVYEVVVLDVALLLAMLASIARLLRTSLRPRPSTSPRRRCAATAALWSRLLATLLLVAAPVLALASDYSRWSPHVLDQSVQICLLVVHSLSAMALALRRQGEGALVRAMWTLVVLCSLPRLVSASAYGTSLELAACGLLSAAALLYVCVSLVSPTGSTRAFAVLPLGARLQARVWAAILARQDLHHDGPLRDPLGLGTIQRTAMRQQRAKSRHLPDHHVGTTSGTGAGTGATAIRVSPARGASAAIRRGSGMAEPLLATGADAAGAVDHVKAGITIRVPEGPSRTVSSADRRRARTRSGGAAGRAVDEVGDDDEDDFAEGADIGGGGGGGGGFHGHGHDADDGEYHELERKVLALGDGFGYGFGSGAAATIDHDADLFSIEAGRAAVAKSPVCCGIAWTACRPRVDQLGRWGEGTSPVFGVQAMRVLIGALRLLSLAVLTLRLIAQHERGDETGWEAWTWTQSTLPLVASLFIPVPLAYTALMAAPHRDPVGATRLLTQILTSSFAAVWAGGPGGIVSVIIWALVADGRWTIDSPWAIAAPLILQSSLVGLLLVAGVIQIAVTESPGPAAVISAAIASMVTAAAFVLVTVLPAARLSPLFDKTTSTDDGDDFGWHAAFTPIYVSCAILVVAPIVVAIRWPLARGRCRPFLADAIVPIGYGISAVLLASALSQDYDPLARGAGSKEQPHPLPLEPWVMAAPAIAAQTIALVVDTIVALGQVAVLVGCCGHLEGAGHEVAVEWSRFFQIDDTFFGDSDGMGTAGAVAGGPGTHYVLPAAGTRRVSLNADGAAAAASAAPTTPGASRRAGAAAAAAAATGRAGAAVTSPNPRLGLGDDVAPGMPRVRPAAGWDQRQGSRGLLDTLLKHEVSGGLSRSPSMRVAFTEAWYKLQAARLSGAGLRKWDSELVRAWLLVEGGTELSRYASRVINLDRLVDTAAPSSGPTVPSSAGAASSRAGEVLARAVVPSGTATASAAAKGPALPSAAPSLVSELGTAAEVTIAMCMGLREPRQARSLFDLVRSTLAAEEAVGGDVSRIGRAMVLDHTAADGGTGAAAVAIAAMSGYAGAGAGAVEGGGGSADDERQSDEGLPPEEVARRRRERRLQQATKDPAALAEAARASHVEVIRYRAGHLLHDWVWEDWLPSLGLTHLAPLFRSAKVTALALNGMRTREAFAALGVESDWERRSLSAGVRFLVRHAWDLDGEIADLRRDRWTPRPPLPDHLEAWTNGHVVHWLCQSIRLDPARHARQIERLRASGLHGAVLFAQRPFSPDDVIAGFGLERSSATPMLIERVEEEVANLERTGFAAAQAYKRPIRPAEGAGHHDDNDDDDGSKGASDDDDVSDFGGMIRVDSFASADAFLNTFSRDASGVIPAALLPELLPHPATRPEQPVPTG